MLSSFARIVLICSIVPWLDLMTSVSEGVSLVGSSASFCTGGFWELRLSIFTTVSPSTPIVSRLACES